jgi:hypothetical protein
LDGGRSEFALSGNSIAKTARARTAGAASGDERAADAGGKRGADAGVLPRRRVRSVRHPVLWSRVEIGATTNEMSECAPEAVSRISTVDPTNLHRRSSRRAWEALF